MCMLFFFATIGEYGCLNAYAEGPEVAISFVIGGNGSGTVQYKIGAAGAWTDYGDINTTSVQAEDVIYLKAVPNEGSILDAHDYQQIIRYSDNDHFINPADFDDLMGGTYSFTYGAETPYTITIKFDNAGGPSPGPGPGPGPSSNVAAGKYRARVEQEVEGQNGTVKIEFFDSSDSSLGSQNYTADSDELAFPESTSKIKVSVPGSDEILNNARLENVTDRSEVDMIDDIRRDGYSVQPINLEKGYEIKITFSNTMSVSWSYDPSAAEDQYVEHAIIELLNSPDPTDLKDPGRTDWQLTAGETYYFLLVPDYGYQIVGLNINGQPIAPKDAVGVFEFQMIHSNFHFQGIVSEYSDIADFIPDGLIGGMDVDADGAVNSGNDKATETEVSSDVNALNAVSDAYVSMVGTIDLELNQVISKGDGSFWETPKSEVPNPVKISIVLPAGELSEGETYSVVRNHDGVYEELEAVYNAETEKLEFSSDKFTEYTIVTKSGTPIPTPDPEPTPDSEPTPDPEPTPNPEPTPEPVKPAPVPDMKTENIAGVSLNTWEEIAANTPYLTAEKLQKADASNDDALLHVNIVGKADKSVPVAAVQAMKNSSIGGLHVFVGGSDAVTFLSNLDYSKYEGVNFNHEDVIDKNGRVIDFTSKGKINATVMFHTLIAPNVKAKVYKVVDGKEVEIATLSSNENGGFCFLIDELGKFAIKY